MANMSGASSKKEKVNKLNAARIRNIERISSHNSLRSSRMSFIAHFTNEIAQSLEQRKLIKVVVDGNLDVTPKAMTFEMDSDRLQSLIDQIRNRFRSSMDGSVDTRSIGTLSFSNMRNPSSQRLGAIGGLKLSMDDIIYGVGSGTVKFDSLKSSSSQEVVIPDSQVITKCELPFIRVMLTISDTFVLYCQRSVTAPKGTRDGTDVEEDNKKYDYLTTGKGKMRRRSDGETQTKFVLHKTRRLNTRRPKTAEKASYVSYFEMYDTLRQVALTQVSVKSFEGDGDQLGGALSWDTIKELPTFKHASMVLKRLLAGNVFEEEQLRFRNMMKQDRLALDLEYKYTLRQLFSYPPLYDKERKSVTDMSFNSKNGDILAVSYGIYSFTAMHVPQKGVVCVWSIKNPVNPERRYFYNVPVVSVKFSPYLPTLLAVGLYDGSVEVRDITYPNTLPIAVSQRSTSPGVEPVMAIQWIKQTETDDTSEIDPFLTLSQDGSVTKYRIIRSPYLLGFKQMVLERVEGIPEGLYVRKTDELDQHADRHPQGLNLTIHPLYKDIFYVLTDEGCLYKCSTNYTHQYLEVWKAHKASVTCMDFSPWSPKLFLTCGNDWCIRVWIDGIFKPLLTLKSQLAPVHCAYWSQTHSTIILAVNRRTFDIWDIRRNLLQPVSSTQLGTSYHTMASVSRCGRSVAIGTERGAVIMAAMDDLPFAPHFQYNELEKALYKAISTSPDLIIELKGIGFFGYPKKAFMKPI